jgi:hypothetical protein
MDLLDSTAHAYIIIITIHSTKQQRCFLDNAPIQLYEQRRRRNSPRRPTDFVLDITTPCRFHHRLQENTVLIVSISDKHVLPVLSRAQLLALREGTLLNR